MRTHTNSDGTAMVGLVVALALQLAGPTGPARADDAQGSNVAVMVPPRIEGGIARAMGERAVGVVARSLASDGYSVIEPSQAVAIAESLQAESGKGKPEDSDLGECTTADCAVWYRAVLNASIAVQITLFTKVGPAARSNLVDSVTVVLVQRASVQFSGNGSVTDGDIEAAVFAAYREARDKQIKGVGPWLTVRGEPTGAQVLLDGQILGPLPHKDSVSPGMHALVVRKTGYREVHESVSVGDHSDSEQVVEVKLEPENAAALAATSANSGPTRASNRKVWYYAAGGVAIGVGAAYAAGAIVTLSRDGEVTDGERYEAGTGTKVKLAAGLVGVAAGASLCLWTGLRMNVALDGTRAAVTIGQQF